jgi:ABC-type multidrug transport system ATPase subunit
MPPEPAAAPAVEARGLSRRFGARAALAGIDLLLRAGEFACVFGPNGAGKSTLLRLLARLSRPTAGSIRIFGVDLHGESCDRARARIGMVGHASFVYAGLTVRENLIFQARMFGVADASARCDSLLAELGLTDREGDPAGTLSRGLLQRLAIARALVHDPDLLLFDEPYTGLDPLAAELLSQRLGGLHRQGRTIILTTHDLALGHRLATRLLVLHRGRWALDARPDEVAAADLARLYQERLGAA